MQILFIHQNFPGQFKFLAPALVARGHSVTALWLNAGPEKAPMDWQGVRIVPYRVQRGSSNTVHPWVADFETKVIRAEAVLAIARRLQAQGLRPDVIVAHPGWGESLFLKQVWPQAKLGIYCEYYYRDQGGDVGFDPEFQTSDPLMDACRLRLKNLNNDMHFELADAGLSPTHWQASTFPPAFRERIRIIHDGIDTQALQPKAGAQAEITTSSGQTLRWCKGDEVVTFVNRNLEPYRGYHIFMRALPQMLSERPQAHFVLMGGDGVSYGAKTTPAGESWKDIFIREVRPQISDQDWSRVHFLGKVAYPQYVRLLQVAAVHVYWTYPFVLSWSLLEAMSMGCAIVASDTAPVREVIDAGREGLLVDFFSPQKMASAITHLLATPEQRKSLGVKARERVQTHYDLQSVCLPQQIRWVEELAS